MPKIQTELGPMAANGNWLRDARLDHELAERLVVTHDGQRLAMSLEPGNRRNIQSTYHK